MVFQTAVRVILGVAFAGVGYFLVEILLPPLNLFGSTHALPTIVAFALGAVGVFLIPAISALARKFFFNFVRILAKELQEQIHFPRFTRGESENAKAKKYPNPMLLDTSAIIDGRILEIAKTSFLDGTILIPRFILGELQHIADSAEVLRRNRGRRGFEIIDELKKIGDGLRVEVVELDLSRVKKADDKLVQLGKKLHAKIITTDYNLNRVSRISGVKILNVNELANSIRAVVLPGEAMTVKIVQQGKEKDQGVGYLPDGTMIVVEGGGHLLGKTIDTEVSRIFQTVAGRMVFVRPLKTP